MLRKRSHYLYLKLQVRNAGRKDGGIKLLDITEQPLGYAAAKKRKRMQGNQSLIEK